MKVCRDLEVSIGYRLPEAVMKRLVAGDCNAPNVLRLPFRVKLAATA
jgi:hypothetical protein